MKRIFIVLSLMVVGCTPKATYDLSQYEETAIYYGGDIVTVDDNVPHAEAVLVGDGEIVAVGSKRELMKSKRDDTRLIDLKGKTMLPGFVDSHSHISHVTKYPDFSPAQGVTSIESLVEYGREQFEKWYDKATADGSYQPGDWFVGNGYDNTVFPGAVGPTAKDLDSISTDVPICLIHTSNHIGVVNSKGLEILKYTKGSPMTERYKQWLGMYPDGAPDGLLQEGAFFRLYYDPNVLMDNERTDVGKEEDILRRAMDLYASYGITTAQDGAGSTIVQSVHNILAEGGELPIDINSYTDVNSVPGPSDEQKYVDGFRVAGVKIFLDGSPQAKTAWLLEPYYVVPEDKPADYRGFPQMTDDEVYESFKTCLEKGYQVLGHTNGSAAIEQYLDQYARAKAATGIEPAYRPVLIHAQTITEEQLDRAEELGVNVSFFNDHTYYWGDYYLSSILGPERSQSISPLKSALGRDINVTIHQDSPVVPPDMLFSIHNAVNRTTRDGVVLGPEYRVEPIEAIRMVTINGAKQYYQDDRGSITPGKIADFVILDANPEKVDMSKIKDIKVLQTIKRGKVIYDAANNNTDGKAK